MKADVAIITALKKELDAVLDHGKEKYGLGWTTVRGQRSIRQYHRAVNKAQTRIVAVRASGMGRVHAAIVTSDVINEFSPKVVLLVGIAAGITNEVQLGDVVVSQQLIDYEPGKLIEHATRPDFPVYKSTPELIASLEDFRGDEWKTRIISPRPDGSRNLTPMVHTGDIFCGDKVVADREVVDGLKKHFRKAIALEMESAGFAALLTQRVRPPHFAMIKAICDRGDGSKNDLWQQYASDAAASFTLAFLESPSSLAGGDTTYRVLSQPEIDAQVNQVIEFVAPDQSALQDFERELVGRVITAGLKEVVDILSGRYQADVGLGRHFLLRAGPLFGKASRIYATSLDTVSTFWTNPDNKAEAGEYLRHQAPGGSAARLFVFSDADTAHKHCKVLDAHASSYQYVYVCSMPYYHSLLRTLIPPGGSVDQVVNRDYAVLGYGTPNATRYLFAELDSRSLSYQQIKLDEPGKLTYRRMIEEFERWQPVAPGRFDYEHSQVLRWAPRMWKDQVEWARALHAMFNERTSDALHMVFFRVDQGKEKTLRPWLADIKQRLAAIPPGETQSMMARYGIKRVWIGRKMTDQRLRDKLYGGLISATPPSAEPYVLLMRFDTEDGLTRFYTDKEHSVIRKEVFEKLDERIKYLYEAAETGSLTEGERRTTAYEAIESFASEFIHRRDYLDDEMIEEMVRTVSPYDF